MIIIHSCGSMCCAQHINSNNIIPSTFYVLPNTIYIHWVPAMHMCPQEERNQSCPHNLPLESPEYISYSETLQRERQANLEVIFPHAETKIYLS